jgi:broad specificity phosphatase PhoE
MAKTVYFIRHGESESNAGQKTEHPQSVNLTERGITEAFNRAAGWEETPGLIVTSAYTRTKQTAAPLIAKFPGAQQEEWNIHEYTYLAASKYKNTTNLERAPFMHEYWDRAEPDFKDGGTAESFAEFAQRCKDAVEKIRNAKDDVTVAYCHGYMINGILMALDGKFDTVTPDTMRAFWKFHAENRVDNCEVFTFAVDGGKVSYLGKSGERPASSITPPRLND